VHCVHRLHRLRRSLGVLIWLATAIAAAAVHCTVAFSPVTSSIHASTLSITSSTSVTSSPS